MLVTSVNPLVVWEFSRCYLRLSTKRFDAAALDDPFVHLCNYAVQKNHPGECTWVPDRQACPL